METDEREDRKALEANTGKNEETETVGINAEGIEERLPGAPFIKSKDTTATIMWDVVIALVPAVVFGVYRFGFRAFLIMLLSVTSCVLTDFVCKRMRKGPKGKYECSAVVTGLIFGMMLPVNVPYWFPIAGGVFAIGIIKQLFGGLGRNYLNPAATAKCLFFVLAGPLMHISTQGDIAAWNETALGDLFFGFCTGMVGEVSAFLLLLGGLYLMSGKVISLHIPVTYLATFSAVLAVFGGYGTDPKGLAMQLCVGGVMLGAFFLATDYTTSPMTAGGKLIYGVILGGVTGALRVLGFTSEAVVIAVLCGNVSVPLIDKITFLRSLEKGRKAKL